MKITACLPTAALALLLGAPLSTLAQTPPAPAAATRPAMDIAQLVEHLVAQGWSDIREIERKSDKLYEVTARDPRGTWMEVSIDARSGEILRAERDR